MLEVSKGKMETLSEENVFPLAFLLLDVIEYCKHTQDPGPVLLVTAFYLQGFPW